MLAGIATGAPARRPLPGGDRRLARADLVTALQRILLGLLPLIVLAALLVVCVSRNDYAVDFHYTYWPAGWRLLHGANPYQATAAQVAGGWTFVYPALAALLFTLFALVPHGAADVLYMLICVATVPITLFTLNVRDWRIYGAALLWMPVFGAWQTSNLTGPLLLAIAVTWRWRDGRPAIAGLTAAVAVSLKPFVWPLVLWLLLTRRWRAAGWAAAGGLVFNLTAWSVVGFGAIGQYLHLSSRVTAALWRQGYGVMAAAGRFGLAQSAAVVVLVTCMIVLVATLARSSWRGRDRDANDARTLTLSVALMLVASPLVWSHYFALLLVPLAVCLPQLAPVWLAPLAMWVCPERTGIHVWQLALAWAVSGICLYLPYRAAA